MPVRKEKPEQQEEKHRVCYEYEDLVMATQAFPNLEEKYLWFISKSGYSDSVVRQAQKDGAVLLTIDDLFEF